MNNNQLVVHNQSVSDIETMAKAITKSGLFGIKSPDQAVALMLVAQSEGRHPASVASEYDIIQGRPALKSQAALARFQAAGGKIQWTSRGPTKCAAKFSHAQGGELEITWTMDRANAAGLTGKQTWKQYPDQMLSARVVAEGVRAVFPACLNGVYLAEEVADFDSKPRPAKEVIELVQEASSAKEVPSLPEPPKESVNNVESPNNAEIQGEIVEGEISWEADWFTPEVAATLADSKEVNAFLIGKKKIKEGQTWKDITDKEYQKRINTGLARFVEAVDRASK
jgi:hypothetical protein